MRTEADYQTRLKMERAALIVRAVKAIMPETVGAERGAALAVYGSARRQQLNAELAAELAQLSQGDDSQGGRTMNVADAIWNGPDHGASDYDR